MSDDIKIIDCNARPTEQQVEEAVRELFRGNERIIGLCKRCGLKHGAYADGLCDYCAENGEAEDSSTCGSVCTNATSSALPVTADQLQALAAKIKKAKEEQVNALRLAFECIPCSVDRDGSTVHPDGYRIVLGHRLAEKLGKDDFLNYLSGVDLARE